MTDESGSGQFTFKLAGELDELLERLLSTAERTERQQSHRQFCEWVESEFGIENYHRIADNNQISILIENYLMLTSVEGESRAAQVSVASKFCCPGDEAESIHRIGTVRKCAELTAFLKRDAAGKPRFVCEHHFSRQALVPDAVDIIEEQQQQQMPVSAAAAAPPFAGCGSAGTKPLLSNAPPAVSGAASNLSLADEAKPQTPPPPSLNQSGPKQRENRLPGSESESSQAMQSSKSKKSGARRNSNGSSQKPRGARRKLPVPRLGGKLREIRTRRKLSQGKMLLLINPNEKTEDNRARVSQYEKGLRMPSLVEVFNYAEFAGVPLEILVNDELDLPN